MAGVKDKVLLVGTACWVCLIGGAAFLLAEIYDINPVWLFLGWNSIMLIPMFVEEFRGHFKRPLFLLFLAAWMVAHGATVVSLMRWRPMIEWPIFVGLELFAGFMIAHWLFGVPLDEKR